MAVSFPLSLSLCVCVSVGVWDCECVSSVMWQSIPSLNVRAQTYKPLKRGDANMLRVSVSVFVCMGSFLHTECNLLFVPMST